MTKKSVAAEIVYEIERRKLDEISRIREMVFSRVFVEFSNGLILKFKILQRHRHFLTKSGRRWLGYDFVQDVHNAAPDGVHRKNPYPNRLQSSSTRQLY
jgi:hypothetical protein